MGTNIDRDHFEAGDKARFAEQLRDDLEALRTLLGLPDFGVGPASLGAELELSLVDSAGLALPINRAVCEEAQLPQLTLELNRFNLEYNASKVSAAGSPFDTLGRELDAALDVLGRVAGHHAAAVVAVGILPTLRELDLDASAMTDLPRYRALSNSLKALRKAPFRIDIRGEESLVYESDDVTLEGAATSFQVHLRVPPARFAALYNAIQLATAPALALSTNSPIFLGRKLWRETRIALFKQAVDGRAATHSPDELPRVLFGRGWLRDSAYALFEQAVSAFPPLLPAPNDEDPRAALAAGEIPRLSALRLHAGTVWRWNRPVFDPADGGHLRIEMRALPSGPTTSDMMASAAFMVGLGVGLEPDIERILPTLTFEQASQNFYAAAQFGMDAPLIWPLGAKLEPRELTARALAPQPLDTAHAGLERLGLDAAERQRLLGTIAQRIEAATTGACWQRRMLDRLSAQGDRSSALSAMLACYLREAGIGRPVHEWRETV
jgi:hypothetical protein